MSIYKKIPAIIAFAILAACSKKPEISGDAEEGTVQVLNRKFTEVPAEGIYCAGAPERPNMPKAEYVNGKYGRTKPPHEFLHFLPGRGLLEWTTVGRFKDEKEHTALFNITVTAPGDFKLVRDDSPRRSANEVNWMFDAVGMRNFMVTKHVVRGETEFTFDLVWLDPAGKSFTSPMNCVTTFYYTEEESAAFKHKNDVNRNARDAANKPYLDIIDRVRSKGGNCMVLADHMAAHLRSADMDSFYQKLEVGQDYGCGR
jgi:hypothetical protein